MTPWLSLRLLIQSESRIKWPDQQWGKQGLGHCYRSFKTRVWLKRGGTDLSSRFQTPSALVLFKVRRPRLSLKPRAQDKPLTHHITLSLERNSVRTLVKRSKSSEMPSAWMPAGDVVLVWRCGKRVWREGVLTGAALLAATEENRKRFVGCFQLVRRKSD